MRLSRAALATAFGAPWALGCSVADLTSGDLSDAIGHSPGVPDSGLSGDVSVLDFVDGPDGALSYVSVVPPATAVGLQNLLNLRYLDVANASTANGAQIYAWSHTGGSNQLWTFQAQSDGSYTIINQNSGSCVDVEGGLTGDGTPVQQYFCWEPGMNQRFVLVAFAGNVQIVGTQSGKCLTSVAQEDGAAVYLWDCSSDISQQWALAK